MTLLITDPLIEERIIADRKARGIDQFDEVWDGVYVMAAMANDEHQYLVKELTTIICFCVDWQKLGQTRPGVNISDRRHDWGANFRIPDVAVFLNESTAENCNTFWFGGPDMAIEVVSDGDRSREKLGFYATVGTRELLLIDRDPWRLSLYRLIDQKLDLVNDSLSRPDDELTCETIPLTFKLMTDLATPVIRVAHRENDQTWDIEIEVN